MALQTVFAQGRKPAVDGGIDKGLGNVCISALYGGQQIAKELSHICWRLRSGSNLIKDEIQRLERLSDHWVVDITACNGNLMVKFISDFREISRGSNFACMADEQG